MVLSVQTTQVPILAVSGDENPSVNATQVAVNVVYVPFQPARLTQVPILALFKYAPIEPKPLIPVWPVVEKFTWKTSIKKGYAGTEQRMALRNEPFYSVNYNMPIRDEDQRHHALYTFFRRIGTQFNYPLFHYATAIGAPSSMGSGSIFFDDSVGNFRDGEGAFIFNSDLSIAELVTLGTITGSGAATITDAEGLPINVTTDLQIAPAPLMRVNDNLSLSMTRFFGNMTIDFAAVPKRAVKRPFQSATLDTFDGLPLLTDAYLTGGGASEAVDYDQITHDTGLSVPNDQRRWHEPQVTMSRQYLLDRSDLDFWRQFMHETKGRQKPFLIPSWRDDVQLSATPSLSASTLSTGDTYVSDYMKSLGNRYLQITTANGIVYRKVKDVLLNFDNTVTLYLETPLGGSVGDNVISNISIMNKVRLATEEMTFTHYINHVEVAFSVATVDE